MVATRGAGFRSVVKVPEFRAVLVAETVSVFGDQLARVALALLVYGRTGSPVLSGLVYALTFVPSVLGGLALSGLADRYPRKRVMVVTDGVRAVLGLGMAIPGAPLWVLMALVAVSSAAAGPFKAAQLSLLPQLVSEKDYVTAVSLRQMCGQVAQTVGFAGGGLLLAVLDPHVALALNALTFLLGALMVRFGVVDRSAPRRAQSDAPTGGSVHRPSLLVVFVLLTAVALMVVPEGLAAPYGATLGIGAVGVGLLLAADPVGSVLGVWLNARLGVRPSVASAASLVALSGAPLIVCAFRPGLAISVVMWAGSGALSTACLVHLQAVIVQVVPDERRGRVMGWVSTWLYASQGMTILLAGAAAEVVSPFAAVAGAGAVGLVLATAARAWFNGRQRDRVGSGRLEPLDQMSLLGMADTSSQADSPGDAVTTATPAEGEAAISAPPSGDAPPSIDLPRQHGNGRSRPPPARRIDRWVLWTKPRPGVVFLLAVEATALVCAIHAVLTDSFRVNDLVRWGVLVLAGLVAAESSQHVERMRRRFADALHVNLSSVWTIAAALALPTSLAVATTMSLYAHLWWRSWRRLPGMQAYRAVFSASNAALCCVVAGAIIRASPLTDAYDVTEASDIGWLAVVIVAYWALNSVLAGAAIASLRNDTTFVNLVGSWRENGIEYATLCLGVLTAALLIGHPWLLILIVLPLYVLHRSVMITHLVHVAATDERTRLLNTDTWCNLAGAELERTRRRGGTLAILMIDLDHLDAVNTAHGTLVGDAVLREVGRTIRDIVRADDLCGRFRGEEFVILLADTTHTDALAIAERLRTHIHRLEIDHPTTGTVVRGLHLTVSIGVALFPDHGTTLDDVLTSTDNAVFAAKDAGRDQVRAVAPHQPC
ncbi:MFS transporter [Actinokineospora sp. G85]|uniref:MFS transporter n=1 Tax=Actinokineospora sp. G85 TaxID=3406626 RepID=UPI003C73BFC7